MKTVTYHNTANLQGKQLNLLIESAKKQNEEVLDVANSLKIFTDTMQEDF